MAQFKMKIAGSVAEVTSLFDSTPHYLKAYLTEDAPDFSVTVTEADLRFEQDELDREAAEEGFRRREFTDPFLERAAIQRAFAEFLFDRDTLLLHGSTVAVDGFAYLFTAACGTGKSTHTRLWREVFGDRAVMVNDDKPFLRITDTDILACGSPWCGKHGLDTNVSLPLKGICLLRRGGENQIRKAATEDLLPMLLHQCHCPPGQQEALRELVIHAAERTPLWQMDCTKDPQAARMAHDAMSP